MRKMKAILISFGLMLVEAFAVNLVRKQSFSGSVAADGSIEISDGSDDSTSFSVVRRTPVVADGDTQDVGYGALLHNVTTNESKPANSLAISHPSTNKVRLSVRERDRSSLDNVATSDSKRAQSLTISYPLTNMPRTANLLHFPSGSAALLLHSLSHNQPTSSIREQPVSVSDTHIQSAWGDIHGVESSKTVRNASHQLSRAPLWDLSSSVQLTNASEAHRSSSEALIRIPSALEIHESSTALQQLKSRLTTLVLLTTIFVFVGLFFAVAFPDQRRGIVNQMNVLFQDHRRGSMCSHYSLTGGMKRKRKGTSPTNAFFEEFEIGEKLGEGAFGVVHVVYSRREGKNFAAKLIDVMESDLELIKEEVAILQRVKHNSLTACCLHEYHDKCFYYLVMPLYSGGDLAGAVSDYIETQGCLLPETLFARLFEQMTKGVAFVHSKQVVHRDIKPENFLLASSNLTDARNHVVVADFGMSAVLDDGGFLDEICGTPIFMSPELFTGKYEFKVDVFALGLSAYVILTGAFAFNTEKEIKTWAKSSDPPPIPPSVSTETQKVFGKTLVRNASQRASARELEKLATELSRIHPFAGALTARTRSGSIDPPQPNDRAKRSMVISGGEIQKNKAARRNRMLFELITDHHGKTMANNAMGADVSEAVTAATPFEIKIGRRNRVVSRYEFWSQAYCVKNHVSGIIDKDMEPLAQVAEIQASDVQLLDNVLSRYSVDRSTWGQGKAKSITDLAAECRGGICFLTEDEKKLQRVVDVVALVVIDNEDNILHQFPLTPKAALGKASQRKLSAAQQSSFTEPRLPAKKMEAWETVQEATDRILDMLNMSSDDVNLNFDVPMRVVKEESTSYPGLMTVYKKHMVEAVVRQEDCSSDKLALWGLPGSRKFVVKTKEGASNYGWLSQEDAEANGNLEEGEEGLGTRYAELPPVKTRVISGDMIKEMLGKTRAKVADMSEAALEELAEQVSTGEVELVEEEMPDGTRSLKRKVTVTMLRLTHQEKGVLLEVSKSIDGGATWQNKSWLPAAKQHAFQNPYYAARKMLTSRFMVAEGHWRMDKDQGGCIIEEKESANLPGLPTIYTKHVVAARLC